MLIPFLNSKRYVECGAQVPAVDCLLPTPGPQFNGGY